MHHGSIRYSDDPGKPDVTGQRSLGESGDDATAFTARVELAKEPVMGRTKDDWIERTGGFRVGESPEQFKARVAEIERLEAEFRRPELSGDDREKVQRRLCDLKGIDFDAPDDDYDDD
jgi:hypothetical protein